MVDSADLPRSELYGMTSSGWRQIPLRTFLKATLINVIEGMQDRKVTRVLNCRGVDSKSEKDVLE